MSSSDPWCLNDQSLTVIGYGQWAVAQVDRLKQVLKAQNLTH